MLKIPIQQRGVPYILLFLVSISSSIMPPLIGPLFIHQHGILPQETQDFRLNAYGFTLGIYFISMIAGGFFWGSVSDRIGIKKTLCWCLVGSIMSYVLCIIALINASFLLFFLGRGVDGLMSGRRAVILSLLSRSKSPRNTVFRIAEMVNALGLLLGPLLCGALINYKGDVPLYYYSSPLIAMLLLTLLNLALLPFLNCNSDGKDGSIESYPHFRFKELLKHRVFAEYFLFQLTWYLYYIAVLPFSILQLDFNNYQLGLFFSTMVLVYIFMLLAIQPLLLNIMGVLWAKRCSLIILICSLASIGLYGDSFYLFVLANLGILFSCALLNPTYSVAIANTSGSLDQGKLMGIQSSICGMSSALIALVSGLLLSYSLTFPFFIAAILVGIIFCSFLFGSRADEGHELI